MQAEPNVTVTAEKAPEQTGNWPLAMLGVAGAEMWLFSITCPHGTKIVPTIIKPCESTEGEGHEGDCPGMSVEKLVELGCEQILRAHFQQAPCACSEPYWLRRGPAYELAKHLGQTQLVGNAPTDCFSAN